MPRNRWALPKLGPIALVPIAGALALLAATPARADVYVVIYATTHSKTGHAGIAIDRYQIQVTDTVVGGVKGEKADTVRTGRLVYYDLWPKDDVIPRALTFREVEAQYYKLPGSTSERAITVESLRTRGVPHKEGYACDGLIRIPTGPAADFALGRYLDRVLEQKKPFDAWRFNCVDFVLLGLRRVLGTGLDAEEPVVVRRAATPNRLYRALRALAGVEVVKNADLVTGGSFFEERLVPTLRLTTERKGL
jgi:hypothetical protein